MKAFFSKLWTWALAHKVIAIALAGVLVAGVTCAIVLPIALHEHSYATEWSADAENHWHAGTCHEEERGDLGAHRYLNACDTDCNVCGATRTVGAHVFSNACDASCNVCGATRAAGAHAYDNACDASCNICGELREITHAHGTTLTAGDTTHYYLCSVCGDKKDETAHVFDKTVASSEYLKAAATATTKAQYWKSCVCGKASATEYFETDKIAGTLANIQDLSKTYDKVELANPTYETNSNGVVTIEWYQGDTKLDAKPVNAGTYKVKVIIAESATYAGVSAEKEFTIAKKAATFTTAPTMSAVTIKYSENYGVNYTTDGDGAVTIEYKVKDAADTTYTTNVPANKGLYTARVSVAEGTNYKAVSATVDFEIEAYVFSSLSTNVVYNGSNTHEIDLAPYGYSGVTLRVTFGNNGNVGAYPNGVVVLENDEPTDNYLVDVGTCTVSIVAKTLEISWTAPTNLVYDGTAKLPVATLTNVFAGDDCTVALVEVAEGSNVNAGKFKSRVMGLLGEDADNYALPLNDNAKTSPEYTITPVKLTVPALSKDYDANNTVSYTFTTADGLLAGDDCTLTFDALDASDDTAAIAVGHYLHAKMSNVLLSNGNYVIDVNTCDLHILDTGDLILVANDVFEIEGEFIIDVTVKQGSVKIGDSIVLPGATDKVYEVLKIEKFHKQMESATVGEEVGLYVDGMVATSEVTRLSFLYEASNIPEMASEFLAKVYLKKQEEGGRNTPAFENYKPQIRGLGLPQQVAITFISHYGMEDAVAWTPGETMLIKITLTTPVPAALLPGLEFTLAESNVVKATGVVVDDFIDTAQSGNTMLKTDPFDTEALTPVVVKITNSRTEALETLEVFVSTGSGGNYLTDFTLELYDEDFVKIAGTHDNTEGTFTKSDSSTWSLAAGKTCYVVVKTTNAAEDVFVRLM